MSIGVLSVPNAIARDRPRGPERPSRRALMGSYGGPTNPAIVAVNPDAPLIHLDGDESYRATSSMPLNGKKAETSGGA
jgi:hypothetical protein